MVVRMSRLRRSRAKVRPLMPAPMMAIGTLALMEMVGLSTYLSISLDLPTLVFGKAKLKSSLLISQSD
jgi:hypothetical protein